MRHPAPEDRDRRPRRGAALRLLIVDDHAIVRGGLKGVLEGTAAGWQLAEAEGGFQALERLRHQDFDLTIVNLSMPDMNGLELLRRRRGDHPQLHVLILGIPAEEQYAVRAFKAGANGDVAKDSAAGELAAAARKGVGGGPTSAACWSRAGSGI